MKQGVHSRLLVPVQPSHKRLSAMGEMLPRTLRSPSSTAAYHLQQAHVTGNLPNTLGNSQQRQQWSTLTSSSLKFGRSSVRLTLPGSPERQPQNERIASATKLDSTLKAQLAPTARSPIKQRYSQPRALSVTEKEHAVQSMMQARNIFRMATETDAPLSNAFIGSGVWEELNLGPATMKWDALQGQVDRQDKSFDRSRATRPWTPSRNSSPGRATLGAPSPITRPKTSSGPLSPYVGLASRSSQRPTTGASAVPHTPLRTQTSRRPRGTSGQSRSVAKLHDDSTSVIEALNHFEKVNELNGPKYMTMKELRWKVKYAPEVPLPRDQNIDDCSRDELIGLYRSVRAHRMSSKLMASSRATEASPASDSKQPSP